MGKSYKGKQLFKSGYRPVVRARVGLMLGIRQPLDGPVFTTKQDAEHWCIHAMVSHYDRRLRMSDARIEPFKGIVGCFADPPVSLLKDIERICRDVAQESKRSSDPPK